MRFRIGPTARRRLFNLAAAVSLLLCHAVCLLWASGLGEQRHIDAVQWSRWSRHGPPHATEFRSASILASSFSGTLRISAGEVRYGPAYLDALPPHKRAYYDRQPTGSRWWVPGREATMFWDHAQPGFDAELRVWSNKPGHRAKRCVLAVRTWFAAALLALPPAAWLYRRLKPKRPRATE